MSEIRVLHIYPQQWWHNPALLLGNRAGLTALRDALNAVLDTGATAKTPVFVNDGEGYDAWVALNDDGWQSASWQDTPEPYADFREGTLNNVDKWNEQWKRLWERIDPEGGGE